MILSEMNIPVKTVNALGKKKINTVNDLVMYFPRKYLDYRKIVPLMEAVDRDCAISGYLESYEKQTDKNMTIIKAHLIEESSGQKVTMGDLLGVAQSGSSHYMDQILAMPNLYGSVKKYAQLLIDNHMEDPLIELYEK